MGAQYYEEFKTISKFMVISWILFLLSTILQLASKSILAPISNGIECILFFINAYEIS